MKREHKNLMQSQFDKKKGTLFFLMNVLNLTTYNGHYYCFSDEEKKRTSNEKDCPLCQIPLIFCDFEKDLRSNMFNEKFLWEYHNKLIFHLQKMFEIDKSALYCFLDNEFHYHGRDWHRGETWNISLSEQIKYQEKLKMNGGRKKVLGPFPQEKKE